MNLTPTDIELMMSIFDRWIGYINTYVQHKCNITFFYFKCSIGPLVDLVNVHWYFDDGEHKLQLYNNSLY